LKLAIVLTLATALAGCGTNRPEIPEELLDGSNASSNGDYPDGPYGVEKGDVVRNAEFRGFRAPLSAPLTEGSLERVSFADYYDPRGRQYELLLVNTAALWCSVCQSEHRGLPDRYAEYSGRGLVLLSALFQDERTNPADFADLKLWVERFDVPFPMLLDPDFQLGAYATAETAPLNLLVDARTMTIIEKFIGDSATTLWQLVDDELAQREAME
jgi:hypothetical protein